MLNILFYIILPIVIFYIIRAIYRRFLDIHEKKDQAKRNGEIKVDYYKKENLPFNEDDLDIKIEKPELSKNKSEESLLGLQQQAEAQYKEGLVEEGQEFVPEKKVTGFAIYGPFTRSVIQSLGIYRLQSLLESITKGGPSNFWQKMVGKQREQAPKTFQELVERERNANRGFGRNNNDGNGPGAGL